MPSHTRTRCQTSPVLLPLTVFQCPRTLASLILDQCKIATSPVGGKTWPPNVTTIRREARSELEPLDHALVPRQTENHTHHIVASVLRLKDDLTDVISNTLSLRNRQLDGLANLGSRLEVCDQTIGQLEVDVAPISTEHLASGYSAQTRFAQSGRHRLS